VARVRNGPHPVAESPAAAPTSSATRTPGTVAKVSAGQRRDSQGCSCGDGGGVRSPIPTRKWWRSPGTSQERLRRRCAIQCHVVKGLAGLSSCYGGVAGAASV
jgi:hypothetical protein